MIIKTGNNNFDEEDMHKLESILSLDYLKPIRTSESKKKAHTAVIVLTPLLYIFAVFGLVSKNYTLFTVEIVLAVFFTAWLIWYYTLGKKTQENLQNIIANALENGKNIQCQKRGFRQMLSISMKISKLSLYMNRFISGLLKKRNCS